LTKQDFHCLKALICVLSTPIADFKANCRSLSLQATSQQGNP